MSVKDVTVLFAIKATQNASKVIDEVNSGMEKMRGALDQITGHTKGMGSTFDATFGSLEALEAQAIAQTERLSIAQGELAASEKALIGAQAAFTSGVVGGNEQMIAASARFDAAQQEVRLNLDRSTAAAERLSGAQRQAGVAAEESSVSHGKLSGAFNKVGMGSLVVVAGLGLLGKSALQSGEEYQSSTRTIANSANISQDAAKKISDAFLTTAGTTTFGAQQMSDAYGKVAGQLGLTAGHAIGAGEALGFMHIATTTAEASGQSLGSTTSTLAKLMQAFKMNTGEAAKAADVMYNPSRLTGVGFSQLGNQMTRMKSQLGALAPSIGDTATFMVDLTHAGISGRPAMMMMNTVMNQLLKTSHQVTPTMAEVGTALTALPTKMQPLAQAYENGEISAAQYKAELGKMPLAMQTYGNSFKSLVDKSQQSATVINGLKLTPVQEQLSQLGVHIYNTTGNFVGMRSVIGQLSPKINALHSTQEKLSALQPIFGNNARKMLSVIEDGSKSWDKYNKEVTDGKARSEAAEKTSQTYEGTMKKLGSTLHDLKIVLGNALMPLVTAFANHIMPIVAAAAKWITSHQGVMKVIFGVVAALASFIAITFVLVKMINFVKEAVIAFNLVLDILSANPIILIIIAIVAAVALLALGFYELYKHSQLVREIVADVGKVFKAAFGIIENVVKSVFNWVKHNWPLLLPILLGPVGAAILIWMEFHNQITAIVEDVIDWIKEHWKLILEILTGPIGWILALWEHFHTQITAIFTAVIDFIVSIWKKVSSTAMSVINDVVGFFTALPGRIVAGLGNIVHTIWSTLLSSASWISTNVLNPVISYFSQLPGRLASGLGNIVGTVFGALGGAWTWIYWNVIAPIVNGFAALPGQIGGVISWGAGQVWNGLKVLVNGAIDVINDLIRGFNKVSGFISFGSIPNIKEIPRLAEGGIVTRPTLALIGEAGPEAVVPLNHSLAKAGRLSNNFNSKGLVPNSTQKNTIVNVNISGQVYGSLDDFATKLGKHLATNTLPHGGVVFTN